MGKRCRFVQPEDVRLPLSEGDWIEVKKRLNVGEQRLAVAQIIGTFNADGSRSPNTEVLGMGEVVAYLLAWSLTDAQDKPVPLGTEAQRLAALKNLHPETYAEIEAAIEAHKAAVEAEDAAKKLPADGGSGSLTTSPSAESSTGPTTSS